MNCVATRRFRDTHLILIEAVQHVQAHGPLLHDDHDVERIEEAARDIIPQISIQIFDRTGI
eukprot:3058907-Pleurochrysis_carterae.AAC.1